MVRVRLYLIAIHHDPLESSAVGATNGRNPVPLVVPRHRVVASHGIGGFTGGLRHKMTLLALSSGGPHLCEKELVLVPDARHNDQLDEVLWKRIEEAVDRSGPANGAAPR